MGVGPPLLDELDGNFTEPKSQQPWCLEVHPSDHVETQDHLVIHTPRSNQNNAFVLKDFDKRPSLTDVWFPSHQELCLRGPAEEVL